MAEIQDLATTDASNTGRWPENMAFSAVNDAGRADEGLLARWYRDGNASIVASGSSNAFSITSNRTIAALADSIVIAFTANHSITGAATLNLNGLGAKALKRFNGNALATGDIISGQPVVAIYKTSGDQWFMVSALAALTGQSYTDFNENASPGVPAANTARVYALDDAGTTRLAFVDASSNVTIFSPAATADEMEAATADRLVPADLQNRHPGHPKAWVRFTGGTAAINRDYGVSSVTDNGIGDYSINWDTAFSDTSYGVVGTTNEHTSLAGSSTFEVVNGSFTTTLAEVVTHFATSGGGRSDCAYVMAIAVGDL